MKPQIIKRLNQLNQQFYQCTAQDFAQSRQYFWQGWQKVFQLVDQKILKQHKMRSKQISKPQSSTKGRQVSPQPNLSVLDVGCGNARFGVFFEQKLKECLAKPTVVQVPVNLNYYLNYYGLDNNQDLLAKARQKLASMSTQQVHLAQLDVVSWLLQENKQAVDEQKITWLNKPRFNLIVLFGVIHHIPSFQLRLDLIQRLSQLLIPKQGLLCMAAWQFAASERFQSRLIAPQQVNFKPQELEKNDYFLDWRRGRSAVRYCHHVDQAEVDTWLQAPQLNQLTLLADFKADGKSQDLNRYLVWRKK
jgi:SAM-dependent methyltransferase